MNERTGFLVSRSHTVLRSRLEPWAGLIILMILVLAQKNSYHNKTTCFFAVFIDNSTEPICFFFLVVREIHLLMTPARGGTEGRVWVLLAINAAGIKKPSLKRNQPSMVDWPVGLVVGNPDC